MSVKTPEPQGGPTCIDILMSVFFIPGVFALAFGIEVWLTKKGWSEANALDMSMFGSIACVLFLFWLLHVTGERMPNIEVEPTPEGVFNNELRRLELISVANRLLALWKPGIDPASSVNDAACQSLQDKLYGHGLSMADSYYLSLSAAQGFMLTYLDAAREGKQSLKGLSWDKAYQLLQSILDSLEHHRPIDDADLLRVAGLKTRKKQLPKQERNNKGTAT